MIQKGLVILIAHLFMATLIIPTTAQDVGNLSQSTLKGDWLYVGGSGPGNYTKIQDAIDDASWGDTVFVYSGGYYENVIIRTSGINLFGQDKNTTVIDGNNSIGSTVAIFAETILKNFTIQTNNDEEYHAGVYIEYEKNIVTNNIITRNNIGIFLSYSSRDNVISSNIIRDNKCGMSCDDSVENNVISKNIIFLNDYGIFFIDYCNNNTIVENDIHNNDYAIHIRGENNTITNNSIISHKAGIGIDFSSNNVISNNTICNNENSGINIYQSYKNSISGNIITDSWRGIDIEYSSNNTITKNYFIHNTEEGIILAMSNGTLVFYNTFQNNYLGIYVVDSLLNNISSNNFLGNLRDARSYSKENKWQGNYWER